MNDTYRGSSIFQPFLIMIGGFLLIVYLVGAMNTNNWLWILPFQPEYEPSRILVREYGQATEYRRGDPGFTELTEALNLAFSEFANLDLVPIGLSAETLEDYNDSSVVMEIYYPSNLRFNTIVRMQNVNQLLIPIEGRHSGLRYVFLGSNGEWLTGAFVMEDDTAIHAALRDLGHVELE